MARFHLPLASSAETIYRSVSMYFMAQYFLAKEGKEPDLELEGIDASNFKNENMFLQRKLKEFQHELKKRYQSAK